MHITLSSHAQEQMRKRDYTYEDIQYIVENKWKDKLHNTGVIFYKFKENDLPPHLTNVKKYSRLIGTTVIACGKCGLHIITVYKNNNPKQFGKDKKKEKYNKNKKCGCSCCRRNNS